MWYSFDRVRTDDVIYTESELEALEEMADVIDEFYDMLSYDN